MKFGGMIILIISHTPKKESGQKALQLGIYCSFKFYVDLLRTLQSQIWGIKWPQIGLKNGARSKMVHRVVEHFTRFPKK